VTGFRHVTFFNIRVAAERVGCADAILPFLYEGERLFHTLLFSAPGAGKTTLLRDCIRQISNGTSRPPQKVGVVDERFELAACHLGVPQNDIGAHTDVLCGCDKQTGIFMLLRTMSPQVIAVDELGGANDARAVGEAMYCGCSMLGTVHAGSMEELKGGTYWRQKKFERYIGISRMEDGTRAMKVYDKNGDLLCLPQS
jgi:stage III sporulation protein AA